MKPLLLVFALAVAAVVLFAAACGDDDGGMMGGMGGGGGMGGMGGANAPAGTIVVRLTNWAIEPAQDSAGAGNVTFRAVHDMMPMHGMGSGGSTHDLAVARKNADGTFEIVGQVKDIRMGRYKDLKLELSPGEYELQCNVVEEVGGRMVSHYVEGMHTPFVVS